MHNFLIAGYLWIKALHLIFVISWMAGMFYLPRLFVYHSEIPNNTEESNRFLLMEKRLLKIIINPAMILSFVFGLMLLLTPGIADWTSGWLHVKLTAVSILIFLHIMLVRWYKEFRSGERLRSANFYRIINEVPPIMMVIIVIMVIVKPF